MKKKQCLPVLLMVFSFVLSACEFFPQPAPTATATLPPTDTPQPTLTSTPRPTRTPKPTITPTVKPKTDPREPISLIEGGFSIIPAANFIVDAGGPMISVGNLQQTELAMFIGGIDFPDCTYPEEIPGKFLPILFEDEGDHYKLENQQAVTVNGADGLIYDISGILKGDPILGEVVVVTQGYDRWVFGLGITIGADCEDLWVDEANQTFDAMVDSIDLLTDEEIAAGNTCKISIDATYGYSKDNPIRVGGDVFAGPARERTYLDNLLGAKGEVVVYERTGSLDHADTILDEYKLTVSGKSVVIYIDEYSYSEPQAPVGFTCRGAFALARP